MDLGIQAKLYEYENMYENLKQGASKKRNKANEETGAHIKCQQ